MDIIKAGLSHVNILADAAFGILQDLPNYAGVVYDVNHSRQMLQTYLGLPDLGCFFVEDEGRVIGLYMGMVHPQWFTPNLEFSELMLWVHADYRGYGLAKLLISTVEEWAKSKGASKILLAAGSGWETERVVKLYNRMGYRTWSVTCCKEV